jgi:hypothetical protein
MLPRATNIIVAFIATALLFTFILGLAKSITDGFAGFWGGLPFWIISIIVLAMAAVNFWEDSVKKK